MSRIALLIPVYNEIEGLYAALYPLINSEGNFDVIVVDDGSEQDIDVNEQQFPFPIVLHRHDKNLGIACALNTGLQYILSRNYEYVARLDTWDICEPDRLVKQALFLDENLDHAMVGCDVDFFDCNGHHLYRYGPKLSYKDILNEMHHRPSFIHPAIMVRTNAFRTLGLYKNSYPGGEDYELFFRLTRSYKAANLDEILLHVFLNPQGISLSQRNQLIRTRFRLQFENFSCCNPHCYLGIIRTSLLATAPYMLIYALKRLLRPATEKHSKPSLMPEQKSDFGEQ